MTGRDRDQDNRDQGNRDPRDRDPDGRPRNARPRDGLGQPLPYGAAGVQRQSEGVARTPMQTLHEAQRLLDGGMPFHAHEVFEDAWKSATADPDRALWKGLAQLAVGLTHVARGNRRGAVALIQRAVAAIAPYQGLDPYGIDVTGVVTWASAVAHAVDAGTATSVPLSVPLRRQA